MRGAPPPCVGDLSSPLFTPPGFDGLESEEPPDSLPDELLRPELPPLDVSRFEGGEHSVRGAPPPCVGDLSSPLFGPPELEEPPEDLSPGALLE